MNSVLTTVASLTAFVSVFLHSLTYAQDNYATEKDVPYRTATEQDPYSTERCRLDLYYPKNQDDYPTVVWFHGGGLEKGNKELPTELKDKGLAVVAANYRLSPLAKAPAYIDDAAAAVAWTFQNIERYGGNRKKIFVSGHSAGGYLTSMIGLDKSWLEKYRIDANEIAGLVPYSGHTVTHFTIRKERGIPETKIIVDALAPLNHTRSDAPPMLLITGDRELELLGRYEENAYLWRMMKVSGHQKTELMELDGYDHGAMAQPAHPLLLKFIDRTLIK
jgi:acetyl esterase/lipase